METNDLVYRSVAEEVQDEKQRNGKRRQQRQNDKYLKDRDKTLKPVVKQGRNKRQFNQNGRVVDLTKIRNIRDWETEYDDL